MSRPRFNNNKASCIRETEDKGPFLIEDCHDDYPLYYRTKERPAVPLVIGGDFVQIASFDPGITNFACRVERRSFKTGEIKTLLYKLFDPSKPLVFDAEPVKKTAKKRMKKEEREALVAQKKQEEADRKEREKTFRTSNFRLIELIDHYRELFDDCNIFVIERQLTECHKSWRLQHVLQGHLITRYRNSALKPLILELDASEKYGRLGCPTGFVKKKYKEWGIMRAGQLLENRGDRDFLKQLMVTAKSKQDDLADTVLLSEAICQLFNLPVTPEKEDSKVQTLFDKMKVVGETKMNSRGNIAEFFGF